MGRIEESIEIISYINNFSLHLGFHVRKVYTYIYIFISYKSDYGFWLLLIPPIIYIYIYMYVCIYTHI